MRVFVVLLFAAIFIQGCSTFQKKQPAKASQQSTQLFESYKKEISQGKKASATKKLQQIIQADPESDLADDAAIELGNLYFGQQEYERAYDQYISVVDSNVFSPKEVDALYLAGKCLYFLDRMDAASSLLEKSLRIDNISLTSQIQIHELLFRLRNQQGDLIDALRSLIFLVENHPEADTKATFQSTGIKILDTQLEPKELEYISGRSEFGVFRGYAMAFLAERHLTLREFDDAARYFSGVIQYLPNSEWADKGQKFLERLEAQNTLDPVAIGVVLPLSGKHSRIAYKTLKGIQLALGIYGEPNSPFKLAIADSEGNTDVAKRAVERLVLEDHVIAIIGSLLSRTANVVSQTAHEFGIASIALSQKAGITEVGDSVFRNSLTSNMQVKYLVDYAFNKLGMRKFAILYPNDHYGVEYANLFWDHVLVRGGEITGVQYYSSDENDFKGPIRRLVGTYYYEDRLDEYKYHLKEWQKQNLHSSLRKEAPDDLLKPVIDFDAIFIPDGTRALGQIAPMLRFNDVSDIQLLGTNLWNSKSVVTRTSEMAKKVLFVDAQFSDDTSLHQTPFFQKFKEVFGSAPSHFEAQAYDSARLLRNIIEGGAVSRKAVIERLQAMKSYSGISGLLTMNSSREIEPPLVTYSIRDKSIIKINGSEN